VRKIETERSVGEKVVGGAGSIIKRISHQPEPGKVLKGERTRKVPTNSANLGSCDDVLDPKGGTRKRKTANPATTR